MVLAGCSWQRSAFRSRCFAFRLSGGYFAIGTWVIAEVLRLTTLQIDSLKAGNVQSLTPKKTFAGYDLQQRVDYVYWAALALAVGAHDDRRRRVAIATRTRAAGRTRRRARRGAASASRSGARS